MKSPAKDPAPRYFGCHVSSSGGLAQALKNGDVLGVNTIQIHPSPPQRWNTKTPDAATIEGFIEARKTSHVEKVFFHAIYLINLASTDPEQVKKSQRSLRAYLELCTAIGGDGVIVHVGSAKDHTDETLALRQAARAIDEIFDELPPSPPLLLEVAAGSGAIVGDRFEELAEIYSALEQKSRVGFALDTQHMWASGYDLANDREKIVDQLESVLGIDRIGVIHVNDSKVELGSRKDRHENLGEGTIGADTIRRFLNHPKLAHIPCLLETPGLKELETAAAEVNKLRSLLLGE